MVNDVSKIANAAGSSRRTIPLALIGAAVLTAGFAVAGTPGASASTEASSAARCHVTAQTIINRKNMSCRYAKAVYNKCSRAFPACKGPAMECRGQRTRWRGWTITGIGERDKGVRAKWQNGRYSFVASGGGMC